MNPEHLQSICKPLKGVTEDVEWENHLVFSVGDKMFCVCSLEPPFTCSFKVPDEEFEELSQREGLIPAPYMARAKWVMVKDRTALSAKEWKDFVQRSYELVKAKLTRKLQKELGLVD